MCNRYLLPFILATIALVSACVPSLANNPSRTVNKAVPKGYIDMSRGDGSPGDQIKRTEERHNIHEDSESNSAKITWEKFFAETQLRELIGAALTQNQELNVRLQEIIIAQAEVGARTGAYLPKVDAGVGAGVEKVGKRSSQGVSDDAHNVPRNLPNFRFGVDASWEIDIWRKLRNAKDAAAFRYLATIQGKNFLITQIVAEIARSYYELMALDSQLEILNRNISIQTDALEVVRLEKQAARVTELAVQRFEAEVVKNQSRKFELLQKQVEVENRINFLLGRYPQPIDRTTIRFRDLQPPGVHTGLPSALLSNRPDVKQAELELQASELDVKVARARFFPSLSIGAGVGYQSFNAAHIVDTPGSLVYNFMGNLTAPLINRAGITADYQSANARQIQAVFNYERTLIHGYTEVVNQLARITNLGRSFSLREKQVDLLTRAIEISNVLFRSARADYMEVLLTRRDALEAEMDLVDTRLGQFDAAVAVYQALGGGWTQPTAPAPKVPPPPVD